MLRKRIRIVFLAASLTMAGVPALAHHSLFAVFDENESVTLKGVKARALPELSDEFADSIAKGKTLADLRSLAREELERQKKSQAEAAKRNSVMSALLSKVECELPTHLVRQQTQSILSDIVRENQSRGVTEEVLKEHERELVGSAE